MRVLAVDYGKKRMGLAVSTHDGVIALPLRTVEVSGVSESVRETVAAAEETEAERVVVGMPINMNGSHGPMADEVDAFVAQLRSATDIDVTTWDERMTSAMADRVLIEADMSRKKRKKHRDKMAAQAILSGYLDSLCERHDDEPV